MPFGVLPGMKPFPVTVTVPPRATLPADTLMFGSQAVQRVPCLPAWLERSVLLVDLPDQGGHEGRRVDGAPARRDVVAGPG